MTGPAVPTPPAEVPQECPHCPDGHEAPERRPWAVFISSGRDHDGQPIDLIVCKTGGQHVAESDAEWLRQVIRDAKDVERMVAERVRAARDEALREAERALEAVGRGPLELEGEARWIYRVGLLAGGRIVAGLREATP